MGDLEIRLKGIRSGTVIPKPEPRGDYKVKGWGIRRGADALVYTIPSHTNPAKPYEKGISLPEWRQAFEQLNASGELTRAWFNAEMGTCAKEGGCNFTTIGGVFELLGYARYQRGSYRKSV